MVELHVRRLGNGVPILLLHGGWGYGIHSFDNVATDLATIGFECIAPDRTGYGRSTPLATQPLDFHQRAAREMRALLDALQIERPILWGHSDGAVIAAWMAIQDPQRFPALVLESFHFWAQKASSRAFFETVARGGAGLGERTRSILREDHGERWSGVVAMNGEVWVRLGTRARSPHTDLFEGRFPEIRAQTLFLQGSRDPRTEPGEIEAAHRSLASAELLTVEAKHVPHGEPTAWTLSRPHIATFLTKGNPHAHAKPPRGP